MNLQPISEIADCKSVEFVDSTISTVDELSPLNGEVGGINKPLTQGKFDNFSNHQKENNEILVSKSIDSNEAVFDSSEFMQKSNYADYLAVKPNSAILEPRYLLWYFRSNRFLLEKNRFKYKGNRKKLIPEALQGMVIPIPKISQQKRIFATLDRIDNVIRRFEHAINLTDELIRSKFISKFGSPLTNEKGLPKFPIEKFASVIECAGETKNHLHGGTIYDDSCAAVQHCDADGSFYVSISRLRNKDWDRVSFINENFMENEPVLQILPHSNTNPNFLYYQFKLANPLLQSAIMHSNPHQISKSIELIELISTPKRDQDEFGDFFSSIKKFALNLNNELHKCKELLISFSDVEFNGRPEEKGGSNEHQKH